MSSGISTVRITHTKNNQFLCYYLLLFLSYKKSSIAIAKTLSLYLINGLIFIKSQCTCHALVVNLIQTGLSKKKYCTFRRRTNYKHHTRIYCYKLSLCMEGPRAVFWVLPFEGYKDNLNSMGNLKMDTDHYKKER